ncbi:glycine-rich RNA-binding protein 1-like, partial [Cynara cardunculus var. scolymus]|uniref:glycine-rich RNA-binding protein 1-like n=1 Tax=Cynara cardunculus var. scolymus TaxID=59895 RepID=UPI000D62ADB0
MGKKSDDLVTHLRTTTITQGSRLLLEKKAVHAEHNWIVVKGEGGDGMGPVTGGHEDTGNDGGGGGYGEGPGGGGDGGYGGGPGGGGDGGYGGGPG